MASLASVVRVGWLTTAAQEDLHSLRAGVRAPGLPSRHPRRCALSRALCCAHAFCCQAALVFEVELVGYGTPRKTARNQKRQSRSVSPHVPLVFLTWRQAPRASRTTLDAPL